MVLVPTFRRRMADPFEALFDVSREMDRVLNAFQAPLPGHETETVWSWPAEVVETSDDIRFTLEAPGFKPENLDITVEDNVLTVSGERKLEREAKEEHGEYRVFERRYGRFERSFVLPRNVKTQDVKADYEHGLLRITLPKTETSKARKIPIGSAREITSESGS